MRRVLGHTVAWAALLVGGFAAVLSETVVLLGCMLVAAAAYGIGGPIGRQKWGRS